MRVILQKAVAMHSTLRLAPLFLSVSLVVVSADVADAQEQDVVTVRGRVDHGPGPRQHTPVQYMRVTLTPERDSVRRKVVYTASDGMYYFHNTASGRYVLEGWDLEVKDKVVFSKTCDVQTRPGQRYFDVPPIVVLSRRRLLADAMRQMVGYSRNGFADIKGAPYADERFVSKLAFPEAETTLVHPGKYANALFTKKTLQELMNHADLLIFVAGETFPEWVVTSDLKDRRPGEYRYYYRQAPGGSPAIQITANRDDQGRYYGYIRFIRK
jgi:hypothetical protein